MPIKPGAAGLPLPGISAAVVTLDGRTCAPGEKGIMVITRPFPGLTPMLWGEPARYGRDYWEGIPGSYYSGDSAYLDEDGNVLKTVRMARHRIGWPVRGGRWVIEAEAGAFARWNLRVGDVVELRDEDHTGS